MYWLNSGMVNVFLNIFTSIRTKFLYLQSIIKSKTSNVHEAIRPTYTCMQNSFMWNGGQKYAGPKLYALLNKISYHKMLKMRPKNAASHQQRLVFPFSSIYLLHFKGRKRKKGSRIIFTQLLTFSSWSRKVRAKRTSSINSSILSLFSARRAVLFCGSSTIACLKSA